MLVGSEGELIVITGDEVLWMVVTILIVVAQLGVGLWAWADMNRRGRSGWLWGLLVWFAPIVGVLLWIALRGTQVRVSESHGAG